jgi:hypothetical protein
VLRSVRDELSGVFIAFLLAASVECAL